MVGKQCKKTDDKEGKGGVSIEKKVIGERVMDESKVELIVPDNLVQGAGLLTDELN